MSRHSFLFAISGLFFLFLGLQARAAESEVNPAEVKLREALRATMLQLRDQQGQVAALQATQLENEVKIKDLSAKLEASTKQAAADKKESERAISQLTIRVADQDTKLGSYITALGKWKAAYNKAAELANSTEAARAKLEKEAILLQRQVTDQRMKNTEMYRVGIELLDRYKKFGLGDALAAREPFVGITRVKFENLVQDYQDKLSAQTIKP